MNKKSKLQLILITITIFTVLVVSGGLVFYNKKQTTNWQFKVENISMNCPSETLVVYSDKKYELLPVLAGPAIFKGESLYSASIDYLIEQIKTYPTDQEYLMNYRVTFNDQSTAIIDINNSPELEKFLETINNGKIDWCNY